MVLKVRLWRAQKLLQNQSSLHRSWEKVILLFLPISWYWDPIVFYYRIGQLVTAKYQALFGTTTYSKRRVMAGVVMTRYAFGFNSQFIKNSCISSIHILHSSWHIAYIFSFLKVQLSEIFQVCASISVWIYTKLFSEIGVEMLKSIWTTKPMQRSFASAPARSASTVNNCHWKAASSMTRTQKLLPGCTLLFIRDLSF